MIPTLFICQVFGQTYMGAGHLIHKAMSETIEETENGYLNSH